MDGVYLLRLSFGSLCKLLLVKIQAEKAPHKTGEPYEFQIKTHKPSRRLAERIKAIYEQAKTKDTQVFTDTIRIDNATLRTLVSYTEGISFSMFSRTGTRQFSDVRYRTTISH